MQIQVKNNYGFQNLEVNLSITNVNDPPTIVSDETQLDIEISEESSPPKVLDIVLPVADPDINTDPILDTLSASIKGNIREFSLLNIKLKANPLIGNYEKHLSMIFINSIQ